MRNKVRKLQIGLTTLLLLASSLSASIIASPAASASTRVDQDYALSKKRFLRFKPQETLRSLLLRHGFSEGQIATVQRAGLLPKGLSLSHGESYRIRESKNRKAAEIKIYEPTLERAFVFRREGAVASAKVEKTQLTLKPRRVEGRIFGSLLASIFEKLPSAWVSHRFMDAYILEYNVPKIVARGARFSILVETAWEDGDMVGYGEILETELEIRGQNERRMYVSYPGGGSFVDPDNPQADRPLFAPVNYLRISSLYEPRRLHPIKRRRQPHLGIDFELPEGEPVFAAQAGVVLRSGFQRASGNFVVLRHAGGVETYYNHLRELSEGLRPGRQVFNGQILGSIGCTGYCTKAHLHFAVKKAGRHVDPARYVKSFPVRSQRLIAEQKAQLRRRASL